MAVARCGCVRVFRCSNSDRCLFSPSHAAVTEQRFWFALCIQVFEFQWGQPTAEAAAGVGHGAVIPPCSAAENR